MSKFLEVLKIQPTDIVCDKESDPAPLIKFHIDTVLESIRADNPKNKTDLQEIVLDGLDPNQVWWQTKLATDSIQGDLIDKIQELKSILADTAEISDNHEEDEAFGSQIDNFSEVDSCEQSHNEEEDEIEDGKFNGLIYSDGDRDESMSEEQKDKEFKDHKKNELSTDVEMEQKFDFDDDHQKNDVKKIEDPNITGLNDTFFNIEDFNKQTLIAERKEDVDDVDEDDENDEDIDYFADILSEEDEEALYYNDFFDKPKDQTKKKVDFKINNKDQSEFDDSDYDSALNTAKMDLFAEDDEGFDSSEDEVSGESKLSTYEKQQVELQRKIAELEDEAVAEKKWTLKGEVDSQSRPSEALLEEDLEFDRTSKPVPVITSEITESLEELIRKRVLHNDYDDLKKRFSTDNSNKTFKPKFELSDTKSGKSLAEIYEDQQNNLEDGDALDENLVNSHNEITELFNNICYKLDALASAHFIPKPLKKSLEVRVDTSAISMEDAQPLSLSSASTLAPQELYKVGKSGNQNEITLKNGTVMSRSELSRDDKNRLRRSIKRKRSKANAERGLIKSKKSKKDTIIETLASAKNVTVINKRGEHSDVKGKKISSTSNTLQNVKL